MTDNTLKLTQADIDELRAKVALFSSDAHDVGVRRAQLNVLLDAAERGLEFNSLSLVTRMGQQYTKLMTERDQLRQQVSSQTKEIDQLKEEVEDAQDYLPCGGCWGDVADYNAWMEEIKKQPTRCSCCAWTKARKERDQLKADKAHWIQAAGDAAQTVLDLKAENDQLKAELQDMEMNSKCSNNFDNCAENSEPNPRTEDTAAEGGDNRMDDEKCTAQCERAAWMDTARHFSKGADFYRDIVHQIGEKFGIPAYTSDDGTVQDQVLALKVPGLVDELRSENNQLKGMLRDIRAALGGYEDSDLTSLATTIVSRERALALTVEELAYRYGQEWCVICESPYCEERYNPDGNCSDVDEHQTALDLIKKAKALVPDE